MSPISSQRGNLWIVSAPSGGGKTSLTRALLPLLARHGVTAHISVSYTTRKPRLGEVDGEHYHFVDEAQFTQMIAAAAFLEHAHVFSHRYGTSAEKTEALLAAGVDVILDIDWQGARQVRALLPEARSIFIVPPSNAALAHRLNGRGQDSAAVIAERMAEAREEISHWLEYEYVVVNDQFDLALAELLGLCLTPRLRTQELSQDKQRLIVALLEK